MIKWIFFAESPGEDEEEAGSGLAKSGPTETCIEMVRTDGLATNLLEKPMIDKKVKVSTVEESLSENISSSVSVVLSRS